MFERLELRPNNNDLHKDAAINIKIKIRESKEIFEKVIPENRMESEKSPDTRAKSHGIVQQSAASNNTIQGPPSHTTIP